MSAASRLLVICAALATANLAGFTVNLSADTLAEADALADLNIAPVAVLLAHDAGMRLKTASGRRVVVCPAQTTDAMTCAECQLCIKAERRAIVGFRSHGTWKYQTAEIVQLRKKGGGALALA